MRAARSAWVLAVVLAFPAGAAPFDEAKAIDGLKAQIAGLEEEPSGQVFQNVQVIPELAEKTPTVNCTTCHRGQEKPAR